MSLLEYLLGDRAGNYLLLSCVLVAALTIIAAIIDIPLASLRDAGLGYEAGRNHRLANRLIWLLGVAALLIAFLGTAAQAYLASSARDPEINALGLADATNIAVAVGIGTWGLTPPLSRHWGLCLGAFGLGLALLFLSLSAVLQLNFDVTETLTTVPERTLFALLTGAVLLAVALCLAAILGLMAHIAGGALWLAREHRRHRVQAFRTALRHYYATASPPPRSTRAPFGVAGADGMSDTTGDGTAEDRS